VHNDIPKTKRYMMFGVILHLVCHGPKEALYKIIHQYPAGHNWLYTCI